MACNVGARGGFPRLHQTSAADIARLDGEQFCIDLSVRLVHVHRAKKMLRACLFEIWFESCGDKE
jgi:hypothetical protein